MTTLSPTVRKLDHLLHNISETIHIDEQWEILEAHDRDIVWNIVMAYLNYYPREDDELDNRLNILGVERIDRNIKGHVTRYNPFLKRNAYICDQITSFVVEPFKRLIKQFNQDYQDDSAVFDINLCLEACSTLLSSDILLVRTTFDGVNRNDTAKLFSCTPETIKHADNNKVLIIFSTFTNDKGIKNSVPAENSLRIFSFGISKEYGQIKQRIALKEVLKNVKFSEDETTEDVIHKIMWLPNMQEDFLISLLKSDVAHYVPVIYKSPYVLTKIQDAGLETDPQTVNKEGDSGLYYALRSENTSLLYFLYDHAANACLMMNSSVRSPDEGIVENLKALRTHLFSLLDRIKFEEGESENLRKLEEIIHLNKFQIEICSNINQINEKYNGDENESSMEESFESDNPLDSSDCEDNKNLSGEELIFLPHYVI